MGDLPSWEIWAIVVSGTVIGSALVFLLCAVLALLLRWWTGVREPPALALFAAGEIVGYFRRRLARRATDPVTKLAHTEPAIAAPPGSSLPIQF
jgi:hypothetical protein